MDISCQREMKIQWSNNYVHDFGNVKQASREGICEGHSFQEIFKKETSLSRAKRLHRGRSMFSLLFHAHFSTFSTFKFFFNCNWSSQMGGVIKSEVVGFSQDSNNQSMTPRFYNKRFPHETQPRYLGLIPSLQQEWE